MSQLHTNPRAKALAAVLLVVVSTLGFWASLITIARWNDLWSDGDFYSSATLWGQMTYDADRALELAGLCLAQEWDGTLSYRDSKRQQSLRQRLSAEATNFRFQVHDQKGNLLCGNVADGELSGAVNQVMMQESVVRRLADGAVYAEISDTSVEIYFDQLDDYTVWDDVREAELLNVYVDGQLILFTPDQQEQAAQYGWSFDGEEWSYQVDGDVRVQSETVVLEYGLADPLSAEDAYTALRTSFDNLRGYLPLVALAALALDLVALALLIFLGRSAGRRAGRSEICLNWQDRIPYDLYLLLLCGAYSCLLGAGDAISIAVNTYGISPDNMTGLALISLAFAGCTVAALLTTVTRVKTHSLLHNTLLGRLGRWVGRGMHRIAQGVGQLGRSWPLVWRVGGLFALYLVLSILTAPTVLFFLVLQGAVLWLILRWLNQWRAIRVGTGRIVGGEPDYVIDTKGMFPDLREHAAQLNDLGGAISTAVEARLSSERFKTELITNVSHDLKTPLTSIINYVDLLKKEDIPGPRAREYLEVLERKSQRLKKLTEDLVEASKASTGNLTVVKTRLGVCQLLEQAAAEYEEKLAQRQLPLVWMLPDQELYVEADGRHVWRVIDNLLGNCYKYALEGTRIYLQVACREGWVEVVVKNISKAPLNLPPEQLLERFVRGEDSRTTEGSGLGLSIARSLIELQGGQFRLEIDGDLFKASFALPQAPPPIQTASPPAALDGN